MESNKVLVIYNQKCSKCRETQQLLEQKKEKNSSLSIDYHYYLQDGISEQLLEKIVDLLKVSDVKNIMRDTDQLYKDLKIKESNFSQQELKNLIIKNPALLQRPIVIYQDKAVIARPPSNINEIL
ncbi:Thioredoxin-like fold [Pseudocohnilembus persalinus]|uniref:Thioredoxin-like fold n=1 Tax=Pseudocohnilembus persalinus TaxID=266149 RepID=A0A0V0QRV0_PSEPJ|nr:Thioredoxin-like fold [Pseudocohnilembus persalinus]|eukprot:KRX04752.1 Thioredoxin-like fold [Pseudocohnilembus persalinus]